MNYRTRPPRKTYFLLQVYDETEEGWTTIKDYPSLSIAQSNADPEHLYRILNDTTLKIEWSN